MTIDELGAAWRRQGGSARSGSELAQELAAVKTRARELEVLVRRRDRIETAVSLLLLPIFGFFAVRPGDLLVRVGSAIVALSCVVIPFVLRSARRRSTDLAQPVAGFLRVELDLVLRQRRLLLSVPFWYLGPLGVGVILFFAGASPSPWITAAYAAGVVVFFVALYRLNRRAVASELDPRASELRLWIELARDEVDEDAREQR